jgi:hypothetical protein
MTYGDISRSTYQWWNPQSIGNSPRALTLKDMQDMMNKVESGRYDQLQNAAPFILVSQCAKTQYCDLLREDHAAWMAKLAKGAMHILGDTTPHLTDDEVVHWLRPDWPDPLDNDRWLW